MLDRDKVINHLTHQPPPAVINTLDHQCPTHPLVGATLLCLSLPLLQARHPLGVKTFFKPRVVFLKITSNVL